MAQITDTQRLEHLIVTGGVITSFRSGYYLDFGVCQQDAIYPSPREAIDASINSDRSFAKEYVEDFAGLEA